MTGGGPQPRTFLFAGGGSGGHLSPGLAVAERLADLDRDGLRRPGEEVDLLVARLSLLDLAGVEVAEARSRRIQGPLRLLGRILAEGAHDRAGLDERDRDARAPQLHAERVGERFHGILGGAVAAHQRGGDQAVGRAHVDDPPRALAPHLRDQAVGELLHAEDVHLELPSQRLARNVFDRAGLSVARVVHERPERSVEPFDRLGGRAMHGRAVRDVERDRLEPFASERFQVLGLASRRNHVPARVAEHAGRGAADAGGATGDENAAVSDRRVLHG